MLIIIDTGGDVIGGRLACAICALCTDAPRSGPKLSFSSMQIQRNLAAKSLAATVRYRRDALSLADHHRHWQRSNRWADSAIAPRQDHSAALPQFTARQCIVASMQHGTPYARERCKLSESDLIELDAHLVQPRSLVYSEHSLEVLLDTLQSDDGCT
jgi:hypothetical protein